MGVELIPGPFKYQAAPCFDSTMESKHISTLCLVGDALSPASLIPDSVVGHASLISTVLDTSNCGTSTHIMFGR